MTPPRRAASFFVAAVAFAACGGPGAGTNGTIDTSLVIPGQSGASSLNAPALAISTTGEALMVWSDGYAGGGSSFGYAWSKNRGESWSASHTLSPPDEFASEEGVLADANGDFYLLAVSASAPQLDSTVYFSTAHAGKSFAAFSAIGDQSATSYRYSASFAFAKDGSLIASWNETDPVALTSNIVTARSADQGATWSTTTITGTPGAFTGAYVCASPKNDRVVDVFTDTTGYAFDVRWSDDDGATWPAANARSLSLNPVGDPIEAATCLLGAPDLWILDAVSSQPPNTLRGDVADKIVLIHSSDGGMSFAAAIPVEDSAVGPNYAGVHAFLQTGDGISLGYYAGSSTTESSVRYAHSVDGGQTFGASIGVFAPVEPTTMPPPDVETPPTWVSGLAIVDDATSVFLAYEDGVDIGTNLRISRRMP